MGDTITVRWEVEDGYAGKARPQSTRIELEDFEDLSDDEIARLLEECIQEDFEQSISWGIDMDKAVAAIKDGLAGKPA